MSHGPRSHQASSTAHARRAAAEDPSLIDDDERIWDPLHPRAWYYGRGGAKLNQSLAVLTTYSLLFFALIMLAGQLGGCREVYELPAGGGQERHTASVNVGQGGFVVLDVTTLR